MKLKIISLLMLGCVGLLAQTAAEGQNERSRPYLEVLAAGNLVNSICGSSQKCWVVHVKNSTKGPIKGPTPKGTVQIDFDYYTGPQDAPLQAHRLTAKGTVPLVNAGADVWVRVMLDGSQQPSPASGVKVVNTSREPTKKIVTDPRRPINNPGTGAELNAVVGDEIPTNYRGFTVSVPLNGKAFQQGQPFTHELTCTLQAQETSAAVKAGKIQINVALNNLGYKGTCSAAAKLAFVITFGYGYLLEVKPFASTPAFSPKTDPSTWGQAVNSFQFECGAFCQQHCLYGSPNTDGNCFFHIDLIDAKGNKQGLGEWRAFPHADPHLGQ